MALGLFLFRFASDESRNALACTYVEGRARDLPVHVRTKSQL